MISDTYDKDNLDTEHNQNDVIDKYLTDIYYKPFSSASYYGSGKLWRYITSFTTIRKYLTSFC